MRWYNRINRWLIWNNFLKLYKENSRNFSNFIKISKFLHFCKKNVYCIENYKNDLKMFLFILFITYYRSNNVLYVFMINFLFVLIIHSVLKRSCFATFLLVPVCVFCYYFTSFFYFFFLQFHVFLLLSCSTFCSVLFPKLK